jgi:hypothetical protein
MKQQAIAHHDWITEARRRFGNDSNAWKFACPLCGHVASVADWKAAGASEGEIAFSCIGRSLANPRSAFGEGPGPCNYAGGGLFRLNPVPVRMPSGEVFDCFAFAEPTDEAASPPTSPPRR